MSFLTPRPCIGESFRLGLKCSRSTSSLTDSTVVIWPVAIQCVRARYPLVDEAFSIVLSACPYLPFYHFLAMLHVVYFPSPFSISTPAFLCSTHVSTSSVDFVSGVSLSSVTLPSRLNHALFAPLSPPPPSLSFTWLSSTLLGFSVFPIPISSSFVCRFFVSLFFCFVFLLPSNQKHTSPVVASFFRPLFFFSFCFILGSIDLHWLDVRW